MDKEKLLSKLTLDILLFLWYCCLLKGDDKSNGKKK